MVDALTDEQQDFAAAVSEFCRKECGTREQRDALTDNRIEQHSQPLYQKLADTGYLGVSLPEEYGGSRGGLTEQVIQPPKTATTRTTYCFVFEFRGDRIYAIREYMDTLYANALLHA